MRVNSNVFTTSVFKRLFTVCLYVSKTLSHVSIEMTIKARFSKGCRNTKSDLTKLQPPKNVLRSYKRSTFVLCKANHKVKFLKLLLRHSVHRRLLPNVRLVSRFIRSYEFMNIRGNKRQAYSCYKVQCKGRIMLRSIIR